MKFSILITILLTICSCKNTSQTTKKPTKGKEMSNSNYTSCQLIEKEFIAEDGSKTGIMELYLRCSIQDYFIKICESKVSLKELSPYIQSGIDVDMEVKEGSWDMCEKDEDVGKRIGTYVIINKIIQ